MALILRIGSHKTLDVPDSLGRSRTGWFPGMTEAEAYEAGRGTWMLGSRADDEIFALVVKNDSDRTVLAAVEIDSITAMDGDGRRSIVGRVLAEGHPVRDVRLGRPLGRRSPLGEEPRIGYMDLPEEKQFRLRDCACGCGTETRGDFAPSHEQKAIDDRLRTHFGGSTLAFIRWMDRHGPVGRSLRAGSDGGYNEQNGPPDDDDW